MEENIKIISDFIKNKRGNSDAKEAIEALKQMSDDEESKRLDLIRDNLKDSHYAKIFDTEIQNVKLQEELRVLKKKEVLNLHNSPNLKVSLFIVGAMLIVATLIYGIRFVQNDTIMHKISNVENTLNKINKKLDLQKQDINRTK